MPWGTTRCWWFLNSEFVERWLEKSFPIDQNMLLAIRMKSNSRHFRLRYDSTVHWDKKIRWWSHSLINNEKKVLIWKRFWTDISDKRVFSSDFISKKNFISFSSFIDIACKWTSLNSCRFGKFIEKLPNISVDPWRLSFNRIKFKWNFLIQYRISIVSYLRLVRIEC